MRCLRFAVLLAGAALAVAACTTSAATKSVSATLTEFKIGLSTTKVAAGEVTFSIGNKGSVAHEFVIVRTDLSADALPTNGDGEVEEDGDGIAVVDEAEDIAPGSAATLTLSLGPGKYAALCNLPGHYLGGMHGGFEVVPG